MLTTFPQCDCEPYYQKQSVKAVIHVKYICLYVMIMPHVFLQGFFSYQKSLIQPFWSLGADYGQQCCHHVEPQTQQKLDGIIYYEIVLCDKHVIKVCKIMRCRILFNLPCDLLSFIYTLRIIPSIQSEIRPTCDWSFDFSIIKSVCF